MNEVMDLLMKSTLTIRLAMFEVYELGDDGLQLQFVTSDSADPRILDTHQVIKCHWMREGFGGQPWRKGDD